MKSFVNNQKVRAQANARGGLSGKTGRVVRLRFCDGGAWVQLDTPPPDAERAFPADDPGGRGNWVVLYPEECEPV